MNNNSWVPYLPRYVKEWCLPWATLSVSQLLLIGYSVSFGERDFFLYMTTGVVQRAAVHVHVHYILQKDATRDYYYHSNKSQRLKGHSLVPQCMQDHYQ